MRRGELKRTLGRLILILLAAAAAGALFNLVAPQGLGLLPPELSNPLWRPVSLERAAELRQGGALFIDARDPGEYKSAHIRGAMNLAPDEWDNLYPLLKGSLEGAEVIVVYGRSRSRRPDAWVAQRLAESGLGEVLVLEAGLGAWQRAGLPVRARRGGRP